MYLTSIIPVIRNLDVNEQATVNILIGLIDVRAGYLFNDHFNNDVILPAPCPWS